MAARQYKKFHYVYTNGSAAPRLEPVPEYTPEQRRRDELRRRRAWEEKKKQRMQLDGFKCVMCGRSIDHCKTLQVHHITYRNLGYENIRTDLCTVCGSCHKKLHNYYNRVR